MVKLNYADSLFHKTQFWRNALPLLASLFSKWRQARRLSYISSNSERNPYNHVTAEAVLQPIQDFLAAIAHDFRQPHAAVHGHEQRTFAQSDRLRMCHYGGIDEVIPHLHNLHLGLAGVDAQILQQMGNQRAGGFGAIGARDFLRRKIRPAPRREHTLPCRTFRRAEWR